MFAKLKYYQKENVTCPTNGVYKQSAYGRIFELFVIHKHS